MRKLFVTLLVPAMILGAFWAPAQAKKAKKRAPVSFEAEGSVLLSNPTDLFDVGVTRTEFENACAVPTNTQGLDGHVIELPAKVSAVKTRVFVTGSSGVSALFDMWFFDESCTNTSHILGSYDGDPIMPAGTKFVLVTNWLGDPASFTFSAMEVTY